MIRIPAVHLGWSNTRSDDTSTVPLSVGLLVDELNGTDCAVLVVIVAIAERHAVAYGVASATVPYHLLSKLTHLSLCTVTNAVKHLVWAGFIEVVKAHFVGDSIAPDAYIVAEASNASVSVVGVRWDRTILSGRSRFMTNDAFRQNPMTARDAEYALKSSAMQDDLFSDE